MFILFNVGGENKILAATEVLDDKCHYPTRPPPGVTARAAQKMAVEYDAQWEIPVEI